MRRPSWNPYLLSILFIPVALSAQVAFHDSINGIYWAQVEAPSGDAFGQCQIVREGLGYLTTSTGTLYEFNQDRPSPWRAIPQPYPYQLKRYFALDQDDIYAIVISAENNEDFLYHWNGRDWTPVAAPHVNRVRDLLFTSSHEGWLACEYGELWRFDRGQWLPDSLPLFLHVNHLFDLPDGRLYAQCEAPDQVTLLRRSQREWVTLATDFDLDDFRLALSPAGDLLAANPGFKRRAIDLGDQTLELLPFLDMAFFPTGLGYAIDNHTIYAIQDTNYVPLASCPSGLREICLHSPTFSWITGGDGLLLAPSNKAAETPPAVNRVFNSKLIESTHIYGLAALQRSPGERAWLYVIRTGLPNQLYDPKLLSPLESLTRQKLVDFAQHWNLTGTTDYSNRTSRHGLPLRNYDHGVTSGDLNGDGYEDLVVTSMYGHPFVYLHSGRDYYYDATKFSGLQRWGYTTNRPMKPVLFDADHDGDLDLFIACHFASDAFFINDGLGRFEEVTLAAGLASEGGGMGAFAADFDGDGWQDLYVTRDNRPNTLYRNNSSESESGRPRFRNASATAGDASGGWKNHSRGAAIADCDNDGDLDLAICGLDRGIRLLQNDGAAHFEDVTSQAGLSNKDESAGISWFDANDDGHLDLAVANKGIERYYLNTRHGRFEEHSELLDFAQSGLAAIRESDRRYGDDSWTSLVMDIDQNGSLDLLIGGDKGLFVYRNHNLEAKNFVEIYPQGIISNRSAVGAKVLLFESGRLGDPAALAGMRVIESTTSYGSAPLKCAHFGVDPQKRHDAQIIFPSGTTVIVTNLQGGDRRIIAEIEGLQAIMIKAKRTLFSYLAGYRSRERLGVLIAGASLAIALFILCGRLGLARRERRQVAAAFYVCLFLCVVLWFARTQTEFIGRPLVVSSALALLAIVILRGRHMYRGRPASIELLSARLNAFGHGSFMNQLMNSFEIFVENFVIKPEQSEAGRQRLLELAEGLQHFLGNEIQAILAYQYGNDVAVDLATRLESDWTRLRKCLRLLVRDLASGRQTQPSFLKEALSSQRGVRQLIPAIKERLNRTHASDAARVIADLLDELSQDSVQLLPHGTLPPAKITSADLAFVIDELVQNALRNLDGRPAEVQISLARDLDDIIIEVRDNGAGIPESHWEKIFRHGFTTKPDGKGGFGLYYARQRLEKFGGKLFVAQSEIGKGTTMRMVLRAEK